ncbi:MAG: ATP synthase F1 subunit epsilon [Planctomycetaceae bacterium]|nr:ATP synthase F1 subunit epsilon [Planctomycetaceae bacterium]
MAEPLRGKFQIILLTPRAKLLDVKAASVVVPAHDGQLGVLRNHSPLLTELGFGIMQVREISGRPDAFFIIEGGFIRVSENHATVLAYEVTTFEGKDKAQADKMLSQAQSAVAGKEYIRSQQHAMDLKRAKYIVQMAEMIQAPADVQQSG